MKKILPEIVTEKIQSLEEKVLKITHTLYGNGDIGLCESVRDIKTEITEINIAVKRVDQKPDVLGKWIVRFLNIASLIISIIIAFKVLRKG